jgi:hypothetical protein
MADNSNTDARAQGGPTDSTGASGTDITGGTDKVGKGGLAGGDQPDKGGDTGVEETGDIMGASSTHAGAGGVFDNNGGTGTAPTEGD